MATTKLFNFSLRVGLCASVILSRASGTATPSLANSTPADVAAASRRCLYNALNQRIRNLLLQYDYSKSTDPLQPLASHITSLLSRSQPKTADITIVTTTRSFPAHKFILCARSPYFRRKLAIAPETTSWKLSSSIAPMAFEIALRYLYLGDIPTEVLAGSGNGDNDQAVLSGLERLSRLLEIQSLWDGVLEGSDRRIARQRRTDELAKGRDQLGHWFRDNILKHKVIIETSRAGEVRWERRNGIFADVLLRADEIVAADDERDTDNSEAEHEDGMLQAVKSAAGIPVGPLADDPQPWATLRISRKSCLFPVHRAILLRSEVFLAMFSSSFKEAQPSNYLQIVLRRLHTTCARGASDLPVHREFGHSLGHCDRRALCGG